LDLDIEAQNKGSTASSGPGARGADGEFSHTRDMGST